MAEKPWKDEYNLILIKNVKQNPACFDKNVRSADKKRSAWANVMQVEELNGYTQPVLEDKWKSLVTKYQKPKMNTNVEISRELEFLNVPTVWYLKSENKSERPAKRHHSESSEAGSSSVSPLKKPSAIKSFCEGLVEPLQFIRLRNAEKCFEVQDRISEIIAEAVDEMSTERSQSSGIGYDEKVKKWLSDTGSNN